MCSPSPYFSPQPQLAPTAMVYGLNRNSKPKLPSQNRILPRLKIYILENIFFKSENKITF